MIGPSFRSGGITRSRVRTPRILSRMAKALLCLAFAPPLIDHTADTLIAITAVAWTVALFLLSLSYALSLSPAWAPGSAELTADALVLGLRTRRIAIPRATIVGALVVDRPLGGGSVSDVEVELAGGDRVTVRAPDRASAEALVAGLGFGPRGARAVVRLAKPTRRLVHLPLAYGAYVLASTPLSLLGALLDGALPMGLTIAAIPALSLAVYAGLRRLTRPAEIAVGDDGIEIVAGVRRRRVGLGEIATVLSPLSILRAGAPPIAVTGWQLDPDRLRAAGQLLHARLASSSAPPENRAAFRREGLPVAAWRERLRASLHDHGGYRAASVRVDDALRVLEAGRASPEERVGAALALRVAGEPPARIRVAAEAAADDRLREALEAVAEGDEAKVERALRAFG